MAGKAPAPQHARHGANAVRDLGGAFMARLVEEVPCVGCRLNLLRGTLVTQLGLLPPSHRDRVMQQALADFAADVEQVARVHNALDGIGRPEGEA